MAMIQVAHRRAITAQSIIYQTRLCVAAYESPGVVSQISLNRMKLNKTGTSLPSIIQRDNKALSPDLEESVTQTC